jgi:hypothetical protein
MDSLPSERRRSLLGPAILVAVLIAAFAYIDFALNVWPLKPGEARWRFGAVGVLTSYMAWLLLGALLLLWYAQAAGRRVLLKVAGVLCALQAVMLLLLLAGFPLDFLQLRRDVPPDDQWTFKVAAARSALKLLTCGVAFAWLAKAGFRASKEEEGARSSRRETSPLIVGVDRG